MIQVKIKNFKKGKLSNLYLTTVDPNSQDLLNVHHQLSIAIHLKQKCKVVSTKRNNIEMKTK